MFTTTTSCSTTVAGDNGGGAASGNTATAASSASLLAAAMNAVAAGGGSPPELLAVQQQSQQLSSPFSPQAMLAAAAAAAAASNNLAAVQQQLAPPADTNSLLYNSMPSPGNAGAFAPPPTTAATAVAALNQLIAASAPAATAAAKLQDSLFGPGSPAAAALLHLASSTSAAGGGGAGAFYATQPHSPHQQAVTAELAAAAMLAGQLQHQQQQQQQQQLIAAMIAQQQQQTNSVVAMQQQQQPCSAFVQPTMAQQQLPGPQATVPAATAHHHNHNAHHPHHSSGSGASSGSEHHPQAVAHASGGAVRKIRRRRPKEERRASHPQGTTQADAEEVAEQQPPMSVGSAMSAIDGSPPAGIVKMETVDYQPPLNNNNNSLSASPPLCRNTANGGAGMLQSNNQNTNNFEQHSPPALPHLQQQQQTEMMDTDADGTQRQKRCRVCGDTATGYNFNVISCESCKAFFRRNALRPKEFKCPYTNDCDINSVSRRFCQKCRLQKCFAVGMKKEWILSEDQLRRRKNARIKSQQSGVAQNTPQNAPQTPASAATTPGSAQPPPHTPFSAPPVTTNAFSPPQNLFNAAAASHHHSPLSASGGSPAAASAAMRAALLPQSNGVPSPLALAALHAIISTSPKGAQPQQTSPGSAGGMHSVNGSPMGAAHNSHNSPRTLAPMENKVSPYSSMGASAAAAGVHSPPPILPAIPAANGQQQYQQQLALAALEQARRASDPGGAIAGGLLGMQQQLQQAIAQQQQQQQHFAANNPASGLSPLVEQCHQLLRLGGQQQPQTPQPQLQSVQSQLQAAQQLLLQQQQQQQEASKHMMGMGNNNGLPSDLLHNATTTTSNSLTSLPQFGNNPNMNGMDMAGLMAQYKAMNPEFKQRMFDGHIHRTIEDELDVHCSPPDSSRNTPSAQHPPATPTADCATPTTSAPAPLPLCKDLRAYALNSLEARDLEAVKLAFASMDEDMRTELRRNTQLQLSFAKSEQSPLDVMNILDMVMRRFVKMAKKLPSFNELSHAGKFALLKAAMIDMLTLRGAARVDAQTRCWKSPLMSKELKLNTNFFDQLDNTEQKQRVKRFYEELHETLKKDQVANNLVMLTVLFNHYTDTALLEEDKNVAKRHYKSHIDMLRRYLESVYGPEEAMLIYNTVPTAFKELANVSENAKNIFRECRTEEEEQKAAAEAEKAGGGGSAPTAGDEPHGHRSRAPTLASQPPPLIKEFFRTSESGSAGSGIKQEAKEEEPEQQAGDVPQKSEEK